MVWCQITSTAAQVPVTWRPRRVKHGEDGVILHSSVLLYKNTSDFVGFVALSLCSCCLLYFSRASLKTSILNVIAIIT